MINTHKLAKTLPIYQVVVSDSITQSEEVAKCEKIKHLSIGTTTPPTTVQLYGCSAAALLADAIHHVHIKGSMHYNFHGAENLHNGVSYL